MILEASALSSRAAELARAFDRSFARLPLDAGAASEDLLAIRVGGDPYALRIGEVHGLLVDIAFAPLPSPLAELSGITFVRGAIVPIYDLGTLLGYAKADRPRWLVLSGSPQRVGFAFEHFDGHHRATRDALVAVGAGHGPVRRHVTQVATIDGIAHPLLQLASALEEIGSRAAAVQPPKER